MPPMVEAFPGTAVPDPGAARKPTTFPSDSENRVLSLRCSNCLKISTFWEVDLAPQLQMVSRLLRAGRPRQWQRAAQPQCCSVRSHSSWVPSYELVDQ
jgi:hypothetical protein